MSLFSYYIFGAFLCEAGDQSLYGETLMTERQGDYFLKGYYDQEDYGTAYTFK